MATQDERYGQIWEGDYGNREGFLAAADQINRETDKDSITGLSIYWSDIPYELRLYCSVSYDPDHPDTEVTLQSVSAAFEAGGGRIRTDITNWTLLGEVIQRRLNNIGYIKGIPVTDPCSFVTKSGLASRGFGFPPQDSPARTFLSHQAERKSEIDVLQKLLSDQGIPTWLDVHDIDLGQSISAAISKGRSESTFVVFWISEGFLRSRWCQFEFEAFLHDYASSRRVVMLPVVEAGCESRLPRGLDGIKYISVSAPGDPRPVARALGLRISRDARPNSETWT